LFVSQLHSEFEGVFKRIGCIILGMRDLKSSRNFVRSKIGIFDVANLIAEIDGSTCAGKTNERRGYEEDLIANTMPDLDSLPRLTLFEENHSRCP